MKAWRGILRGMAETRRYWSHIHREALRRSWSGVMGAALNVLLSLVGIGAAFWALWAYGSEDALTDEVIARFSIFVVCFGAVVLQYFYWLVRIPAEIDDELRGTISKLEQRLEPKIIFVWRPQDNKFFEETQIRRGQQWRKGKIGRIAVKNTSKSETVRDLHVSLVNYLMNDQSAPVSIDRRLVGNNVGNTTTNLHASREESYEVFRIYEGKNTLRLAPYDETEVPKTLPNGTYKLKITASATGMSRLDEYFFLRFDNYHDIEFRPWMRDDVLAPTEQLRTP